MTVSERLHMPSLGRATEWLNSEPLGGEDPGLHISTRPTLRSLGVALVAVAADAAPLRGSQGPTGIHLARQPNGNAPDLCISAGQRPFRRGGRYWD